MKKVLLAIMIVMFWAGSAFAVAATTGIAPTQKITGNNDENMALTIVDTTNAINAGANETFKINAYSETGVIKRVIFESESTVCAIQISLTDLQSATSAETIYSASAINKGSMSPVLDIDYYNPTGETGAFLYFKITNTTTNITTSPGWTLTIIYERG